MHVSLVSGAISVNKLQHFVYIGKLLELLHQERNDHTLFQIESYCLLAMKGKKSYSRNKYNMSDLCQHIQTCYARA